MTKFKVGDRVRSGIRREEGRIRTATTINGEDCYTVSIGTAYFYCMASDLELIKPELKYPEGCDPEKTAIHCPTKELAKRVLALAHDAGVRWSRGTSLLDLTNYHDSGDQTCYRLNPADPGFSRRQWYEGRGYKIIPAEEFLKLNNIKVEKKYKVTREDFKRIYDIACSEWKSKIHDLTGSTLGPFGDVGGLSEDKVREMFDAAGVHNGIDQKEVLQEIFPDYRKGEDKNAFVRNANPLFLRDVSLMLFGDTSVFQLTGGAVPHDRPDLKHRSFWVNSEYSVNTISDGEGTIIEIKKK